MKKVQIEWELHQAVAVGMMLKEKVEWLKLQIKNQRSHGECEVVLGSLEPAYQKLGSVVEAAIDEEEKQNGEGTESDGIELS